MRRALCVIAATSLCGSALAWSAPACALAHAKVVVLGGAHTSPPAGLVEALRIQLGKSADVVDIAVPDETENTGSTSDRAAAALRALGASAVLWLDDANEPAHVWVVTTSAPDARIELGGLDSANPERDRVLALKVEELLEREPSVPRSSEQRARTRAFIEPGLRAWGGGSPTQLVLGPALAIGPRWEWPSALFEVHGSFVFDPTLQARAAAGRVEVSTTFIGVGSRVLWRAAPFAIGPYLEAGVDVLRARGTTADQRLGSAELLVPSALFGCDLRLDLAPRIELRASAGPQILYVRERLALEAQPVLDFGRVHGTASLSGLFVFP